MLMMAKMVGMLGGASDVLTGQTLWAFGHAGGAGLTGTYHEFSVPGGCYYIRAKCWGSSGGDNDAAGSATAPGGEVQGGFAVVPGEVLIIIAGDRSGTQDITKGGGGRASVNGSANPAGHGGGFSGIIRKKVSGVAGGQITIPLTNNPGPVLLIAGGGGGSRVGLGNGGQGSGTATGTKGADGSGSGGSPVGGQGGGLSGASTAWLGGAAGTGGGGNQGKSGGGGGGRFGGNAGAQAPEDSYGAAGGGGSGWVDPIEVTVYSRTTGVTADPDRAGAGAGTGLGRVFIELLAAPPA